MKKINIIITDAGRKEKYIAIEEKNGSYVPAVFFRKSKFVSKKQFDILMKHILDSL